MNDDGKSLQRDENENKNIHMKNNLKDYSYNNQSISKNKIKSKMNLFKQKISNENLNRQNIKYNIEISVDFKKEINNCTKNKKYTLNNFLI